MNNNLKEDENWVIEYNNLGKRQKLNIYILKSFKKVGNFRNIMSFILTYQTILIFILVGFVTSSKGVTLLSSEKNDKILPKYIGGDKAFFKYLSMSIKYPPYCLDNCIQGIVVIHFEVDSNGGVNFANPKNSVHELLDKEAIRVIESTSGLWTPGMFQNKKCNVEFNIPISFRLKDSRCIEESNYYFLIGQTEFKKGNLEIAESNFVKAFRSNPQNIDAIYNCAIIKLKLNDLNAACNLLNYIKILGRTDGDELSRTYCGKK